MNSARSIERLPGLVAQACLGVFVAIVLMVWSLAADARQPGPACVKDDLDRKVCVSSTHKGALRLVSLAPHLTEIVFFLGAGSSVLAVDRSSDYPEEVKRLPKVGDSLRLDLERVVALKPDLVLAWGSGTSQTQINQLQQLGVPVFVSEPLSIAAIASTMRRLSVLLGVEAEKKRIVDQWQASFPVVSSTPKARVFYQVWHDPLMTLSGKHVVSEVIGLCGGYTAFSDARLLAPTVSLESVLKFNPQLILANAAPSSLAHWSRWSSLEAVRNNQVKILSPDILVRSGPRILEASREVCAMIQEAKIASGYAGASQ